MALTDAQLKVLLLDYRNARVAFEADKVTLENASRALAQGLGPNQEVIVQSRRIRANADGTDVVVENVRVVV
jgi:hypothetical protein